jgi:hypothetical protein
MGRHGRDRMVVGFTTTMGVEFTATYAIFVSDLRQVDSFLRFLRFPPPIKMTATI